MLSYSSVILVGLVVLLQVATSMDVLSFPIQYSLLSSGSYTDLSSMVFYAHHINSRTLLLLA